MRLSAIAIVIIAAMPSPGLAGGDGDDAGFEIGASFYAPSKNIVCNYYDAGGEEGTAFHDQNSEIHCGRLKPTRLVVKLTGKGELSIDTNPKGDNMEIGRDDWTTVLAYGATSKSGVHVCQSTRAGITCTVKGKGFLLSRSGVKKIH